MTVHIDKNKGCIVANFFSVPSAGKSTGAAYEMAGINAELITKFAKDKVEVIVTDSPLPLSTLYKKSKYLKEINR